MEYIVGVALALFVCVAASWLGMDRDRVFYPTMLIVVASYYVAFAVIDGGDKALRSEIAIAAVFTVIAVAGFKRNLWLVAAALAGHGVMDLFHHTLVHNAGVPRAWPGFCMAFDLTAGVFVGCVLAFRANGAVPHWGDPQRQITRLPREPAAVEKMLQQRAGQFAGQVVAPLQARSCEPRSATRASASSACATSASASRQ